MDLPVALPLLSSIAEEAGQIALSYFRRDPEVWYKNEGRSPVSEADIAVDQFLKKALREVCPVAGWLSEETTDDADRLRHRHVFIADPIDGTRAYVGGKIDWCISLALVEDGQPVAGVLVAPARNETWSAQKGRGARLNGQPLLHAGERLLPTALRTAMPDKLAELASRRKPEGIARAKGGPSLALRLAAIAGGELDAVIVRPRSNEWDLAAAHLLLSETGHMLVDPDGHDVSYNQPDPGRGLLFAGGPASISRLIAFARSSGIDV